MRKSGLKVIKPGARSLLQDGGRVGWQHVGVCPAGPIDTQAASWANYLVGNPRSACMVEIAIGSSELQIQVDTWLGLAGPEMQATLNGQPVPGWSRFQVRAGQTLKFGYARFGQRAYLAAAGGFQVGTVLGSASTHVQDRLGGIHGDGTALQAGDLIPCNNASNRFRTTAGVSPRYIPDYSAHTPIRLIPGVDSTAFGRSAFHMLLATVWSVSTQSDRRGIRLSGPVKLPVRAKPWSQGMVTGAVQVPPDGQPIVLGADRQTTGGYPVIGFVHPLDLGILSQRQPKSEVCFGQVDLETAINDIQADARFWHSM